jgi:poly(3-hydroxybutyrate) depolymerase
MSGVTAAAVELSPIAWTPGSAEYELPVAGQGKRAVTVWLPEASEPRALVVLLHGAVLQQSGQRRPDLLGPTRMLVRCLAAPALAALDPIIIAPASPTGQWWLRDETALVLGLVLAARERWPSAGSHSVISGYSNGGIGAWYFARLYPEYFAAAVPMAANATIAGDTPLPVFAIHGTKDETFAFPAVRDSLQALIQRGADVTLEAKYRGTHRAVCSYAPELVRAGQWIERRVLSPGESTRAP